eukprot:CAMPEP_0178750158 /NCGR_PEP_ID=MMETSP0744-20121128/9798_1 /TAXON_ID=913974 /ORGANISM="Nitzschia punctata, Strain CCMP561" /LENGTH=45 /DNA_ID= /DNA_START= /DNA_END= /DNA_ORIENTATION=
MGMWKSFVDLEKTAEQANDRNRKYNTLVLQSQEVEEMEVIGHGHW